MLSFSVSCLTSSIGRSLVIVRCAPTTMPLCSRLTKTLDDAVGLKQHPKKIQVWGLGDSVEHLGVVATMIDPFQPVPCVMAGLVSSDCFLCFLVCLVA